MTSPGVQAHWVGIDVAAEKFDAAIAPLPCDARNWMKAKCRKFALTPAGVKAFVAWVEKEEGACEGLCAESTGIYSERLRTLLAEHSTLPRLAIENPDRIKGMARMLAAPGKTDEIDARVIAFYGATNRPVPKPPLPPGQRRLREATRLRDTLVEQGIALHNQLESFTDAATRKILQKLLVALERELARAEKLLDEIIAEDEQLARDRELLESVPGIGKQVAVETLGFFGDLRQWSRRELIARAGLVPLPRESGKSVRGHAHLSRRGGAKLRRKLYMPATKLLSKDYGYNAGVKRRYEDNTPGKVCICAGMRKVLLVARAVVISGKKYDKSLAERCAPLCQGTSMEGRSGG